VRDRTGQPVGCALFGKGGVDVRGARCLERLGSQQTGGEPRFPDEQHALSGVALFSSCRTWKSHLLATLARRDRADWQAKYGHPVHALETFVDRDRFK